jgi:hypothetical protein
MGINETWKDIGILNADHGRSGRLFTAYGYTGDLPLFDDQFACSDFLGSGNMAFQDIFSRLSSFGNFNAGMDEGRKDRQAKRNPD